MSTKRVTGKAITIPAILAGTVASRLLLICREPGMIKMRTTRLLQSTEAHVPIPG
jgi:hypothetical protein